MVDFWSRRWKSSAMPILALMSAVSAWIWPFGIGGRMPVGGDVTNFSIGLMSCLARSIHQGRLPFWNDLWGFGFPGIAESQMGVYYPPHLMLYGLFSTEVAYSANLAIHSYWAAFGAYWMARKFGVSPWGSALSGFAFTACGTSVIQLSHHWSYSTASWMPWIWGLAFVAAGREGTRRSATILAGLLAIQILPGHFQFAFITQVGVSVIAACRFLDRSSRDWRGLARVVVGMMAVAPLSAMQLWPTWQLARSAESLRDFEYLSAFATPPAHLISLVAPNLFHESPLWRSVVWDPLRAMPEEHRLYVGLVPLWLALGAVRRGFRRDAGTWLLTTLVVLTLLLSFGPYVPGFSQLIRLPGFSFFRAPARWGMASSLAISVLAGKGFDAWRDWPRRGRAAIRFGVLAIFAVAAILALFELALASTEGAGIPSVAAPFENVRQHLPWPPENSPTFRQIMASARSRPADPQVQFALMREGIDPEGGQHLRLDRERLSIYLRELGESAFLIFVLIAAAPFLSRRNAAGSALLFAMTVADLLLLAQHREIKPAPMRPLTELSPTLTQLAAMPPGSRTIDNLRNLPMIASAAPVLAYRTLDRPAALALTSLAYGSQPRTEIAERIAAMRVLGVSARVFSSFEPRDSKGHFETVSDPTLATWLYGSNWIATSEGKKSVEFRIWKPVSNPSNAWFLADRDRPAAGFPSGLENPAKILAIFEKAVALRSKTPFPERVETELGCNGPGLVIFSILDDAEWQARVIGASAEQTVQPTPIFGIKRAGAWQSVPIPQAGTWKIVLEYRGLAAKTGLKVSAGTWLIWLIVFAWPQKRKVVTL